MNDTPTRKVRLISAKKPTETVLEASMPAVEPVPDVLLWSKAYVLLRRPTGPSSEPLIDVSGHYVYREAQSYDLNQHEGEVK
jgi:hypothetical protein